jgi:hypothetical protein
VANRNKQLGAGVIERGQAQLVTDDQVAGTCRYLRADQAGVLRRPDPFQRGEVVERGGRDGGGRDIELLTPLDDSTSASPGGRVAGTAPTSAKIERTSLARHR